MVRIHDAAAVALSQHRFRTSRHVEAAKRKEDQISMLQMDEVNLSYQVCQYKEHVQKLSSELESWHQWWSHGGDQDILLQELGGPDLSSNHAGRQESAHCSDSEEEGTESATGAEVCEKCDGAHSTDECPYFTEDRDDHPDGSIHLEP